ncbi:signal recognition particle, SRP9/SRP14 subunit [Syncephalis fuscata]|nr:signal recognition particle, SRP9/SRP14 subunit [Syncephalis fuscata]
MTRVGNDEFLKQIPLLFAGARDKNTVYLTQKRYDYETKAKRALRTHQDDKAEREYACVWRITCAKEKFSTVVEPENLATFLTGYAAAVRSQATSLKKKDKRRKRNPAKSTGPATTTS